LLLLNTVLNVEGTSKILFRKVLYTKIFSKEGRWFPSTFSQLSALEAGF